MGGGKYKRVIDECRVCKMHLIECNEAMINL